MESRISLVEFVMRRLLHSEVLSSGRDPEEKADLSLLFGNQGNTANPISRLTAKKGSSTIYRAKHYLIGFLTIIFGHTKRARRSENGQSKA